MKTPIPARLTPAQFDRIRSLARRLAGIELLERHRDLIHRRWHHGAVRSPTSLDALLSAAEHGDRAASRQLVELITTKFTGFFRHPMHFETAARHAVEVARQRGAVTIWSAAAATGEEPYSLAIALREAFGRDDPPATILATDINEESLRVAQRGHYGEVAMKAVTPERRRQFFDEAIAHKQWHFKSPVRLLVEFRPLNLIDPSWPLEKSFDMIFCRNVLIYLEAGCRQSILGRMASLLAPDGLLFLDPVEHSGPVEHLFAPGKKGIYSRRLLSPMPFPVGRAAGHRTEPHPS